MYQFTSCNSSHHTSLSSTQLLDINGKQQHTLRSSPTQPCDITFCAVTFLQAQLASRELDYQHLSSELHNHVGGSTQELETLRQQVRHRGLAWPDTPQQQSTAAAQQQSTATDTAVPASSSRAAS
jgi:hypothetical protein